MRLHNIRTIADLRNFSHRRNGIFGQLCMTRTIFESIIGTDFISTVDRSRITECLEILNEVTSNWDKHYVKNLNITLP